MKKDRVNFANILIASGFDRMKVLNLLGIPIATTLIVEANAIDEHEVNLIYNQIERLKVDSSGKPFKPAQALTPNYDHVESMVINDGTGDWSIDRSKITIEYSNGANFTAYFGAKESGPGTDSRIPVIHRCTIPPAPGWPPLKTENYQYPVVPD